MGALFGVNGGKESVRDALSAPVSDPIMYQLVRVEGDGRLIPATDDDVIEVDHLLEDNKIGMFSVEDLSHSEVGISNEVLSSKKSSTKGLSQSETAAIKSQKLSARLEYIEVILQKVKQEERLRLSCESLHSFPNYMDVDCKPSDCPDNSLPADEKLQMRNISKETIPCLVNLNGNYSAQSEGAETCSVPATLPLSVSELPASLKPDLSISKGENFLENLTVTELQEVFKTTFGRPTTVKDKSWLKRRIAMGLGNSYDPPVTNSVIKDKTLIHNIVKEQSFCRVQDGEFKSGSPSIHRDNESANDPCLRSSLRPTTDSKDCPVLSGKKLRRSVEECDTKSADILMEQFALKRVRKPTKRYIEQLSEVETRESTDTLTCSEKTSGHGQSSPVSRAMNIDNISSWGKTFVTRHDYIGGVDIQIPYVYRVRRGRPRKNFMALMTVVMESKRSVTEAPGSDEEQELKHRKTSLSGNFSDENTETLQDCKLNARRKHHRAWTLGEVMRLIEGVAQYGTGRWSEIKRVSFASHSYRTSVDLKDKWRNLLKASFAQGPMDKGVRKHASVAIPTPILMRVKELAELHSQPGAEFGPSKPAIDSGKSVQERESGFL